MINNLGVSIIDTAKFAGLALLTLATLAVPYQAQAEATSEVIFAGGSDCGFFKGDLSSGRSFSITMRAGQELVVKTDGHVQQIQDTKGEILVDKGGFNYRYSILNSGTHTLKMVGRAISSAEFCVY